MLSQLPRPLALYVWIIMKYSAFLLQIFYSFLHLKFSLHESSTLCNYVPVLEILFYISLLLLIFYLLFKDQCWELFEFSLGNSFSLSFSGWLWTYGNPLLPASCVLCLLGMSGLWDCGIHELTAVVTTCSIPLRLNQPTSQHRKREELMTPHPPLNWGAICNWWMQ